MIFASLYESTEPIQLRFKNGPNIFYIPGIGAEGVAAEEAAWSPPCGANAAAAATAAFCASFFAEYKVTVTSAISILLYFHMVLC